MELTTSYKDRTKEIMDMFISTFTDSEGEDEGQLIGKLAMDMFATLNGSDMRVLSALHDSEIAGTIIFTRLIYDQDNRTVFLLAPVAVATKHQGKGIGQMLIRSGLENLRGNGVDIAITYGDPKYYTKLGFSQITEKEAKAPLTLQYPEGWLGQSLTERPLDALKGPSRCVEAINSPDYW